MRAFQTVATKEEVQAFATVIAETAGVLSVAADQVAEDINSVKKALVPAVGDLATQLKQTHNAIAEGAREASRGTDALVRWSKALVVLTGAYVVVTLGQLVFAIYTYLHPK